MKHNQAGHSIIGLLIFVAILAAPTSIALVLNLVINGCIC